MRSRRYGTDSAQALTGKHLHILTSEHVDIAVGNQRHGRLRIPTAIFDRDDARVTHDASQGLALNPHPGAIGNVIEHHRHRRRIGNRLKEAFQPLLRRANIARRRHQQPGQRTLLNLMLKRQQFTQVVAAQPHDHLLRRRPLQHRIQHRKLLALTQRRRLAGRAADYQPRHAICQQALHQPLQRNKIHLSLTEWRYQRYPDPTKIRHAKTPCGRPSSHRQEAWGSNVREV